MVNKTVLDDLVRRHTAFASFDALCNAPGGYFPTLRTRSASTARCRRQLAILADYYDDRQEARRDRRRAHRC